MYFCEQHNITHFAFRWILHYPMRILLGPIWLEGLKSRRMEDWEGIEKWEDRRYLVFSYLCLVEKTDKWKDEKLIC